MFGALVAGVRRGVMPEARASVHVKAGRADERPTRVSKHLRRRRYPRFG
jgi:hypothetical protein